MSRDLKLLHFVADEVRAYLDKALAGVDYQAQVYEETLGKRWGLSWEKLQEFLAGKFAPGLRTLYTIKNDTGVSIDTMAKALLLAKQFELHTYEVQEVSAEAPSIALTIKVRNKYKEMYKEKDFLETGFYIRYAGRITTKTRDFYTGLSISCELPLAYSTTGQRRVLVRRGLQDHLIGENLSKSFPKRGGRIAFVEVGPISPLSLQVVWHDY